MRLSVVPRRSDQGPTAAAVADWQHVQRNRGDLSPAGQGGSADRRRRGIHDGGPAAAVVQFASGCLCAVPAPVRRPAFLCQQSAAGRLDARSMPISCTSDCSSAPPMPSVAAVRWIFALLVAGLASAAAAQAPVPLYDSIGLNIG